VLIVPDLESGNMLAKSLSFLAGADAAGIVLGARVPIILTSRADTLTTPARVVRGRRPGREGRRDASKAVA
jgi:phosphate acetyltransferase